MINAICIAGTWRIPENVLVTDYAKQPVNIRYRDEIAGRMPRSTGFKVAMVVLAVLAVVIVLEISWRVLTR